MKFKSIDDKELYEGRLRLTEPTILFEYNTGHIAVHTVEPDEVGRPDVISNMYFNDTDYVDYILKYNKISNPFSISEGDILFIPDVDAPLVKWKKAKSIDTETLQYVDSIRSQFLDTKRLSVKDAKRVEYLKEKAAKLKNGSKEILPPNILKSDETNIDITDRSITI